MSDRNYYTDPRVMNKKFNTTHYYRVYKDTLVFTKDATEMLLEDELVKQSDLEDDAERYGIPVQTEFVICDQCNGSGSTVSPAIDCNGLTAEDLYDHDFADAYFSGAYDERCSACPQYEGRQIVVTSCDRQDLLKYFDDLIEDNCSSYLTQLGEMGIW